MKLTFVWGIFKFIFKFIPRRLFLKLWFKLFCLTCKPMKENYEGAQSEETKKNNKIIFISKK